ncbi:MAG: hypothetical protein AAB468_02460 [Patescibacteria group bacterium]
MSIIWLTVFQGIEARNLLRTDFFDILSRNNQLKIVLLVNSQSKKIHMEKEFSRFNVVIEVVDSVESSALSKIFSLLKYIFINTDRIRIRHRVAWSEGGNVFAYLIKRTLTLILANSWCRRVYRYLDYSLSNKRPIALFERYPPSLFVSAHLFGETESSLVRQARKLGVKTIGVINSWDKLVSRGMIRTLPDHLIVHNEIIKDEAVCYADMPVKEISVVGIPHYDYFFTSTPRSRQALGDRVGMGLSPYLLFCPTGQFYSDSDQIILDKLIEFKKQGIIPHDHRILVRYPPNDIVDINHSKYLVGDVFFYQPGIRFSVKRGIDWDMGRDDCLLLMDMLYWCEMVICPPSSVSVDAAIFDRPIINVKIPGDNRWSNKNINLFYDSDHYKKLLSTDGVKVTNDFKELAEAIKKYLSDPSVCHEGRLRIVQEQCWRTDGLSGMRMAQVVLNLLDV